MTKLTDTQRVILSTASQRTDRLALPLPRSIKGGAALKVINPLIQRGSSRRLPPTASWAIPSGVRLATATA